MNVASEMIMDALKKYMLSKYLLACKLDYLELLLLCRKYQRETRFDC